ncbi:probable glutathione S-transferase parA [Phragmites australis]|uniref:probable glutathione S-transferase parA n=1 Tax=Phragmites australis TaxID=29695 RepID=UPI002D78E21E|nr:probable glutathione S-transferase parA [Phragmites australis]
MEGDKANGGGGGDVVLLNCFVSPFGNRVKIALARKGVAYEEKSENLAAKSPLLLSSNPVHAKIPVLLVGGKAVSESLVILEFVEEVFSSAGEPLLPGDPYARAQARFWASYIDTKLPECAKRVWQSPKGAAAAEEGKRDMVAVLNTLEAELGGKPYFGGEAFGYVDVALVPFAPWFTTYERLGGFSVAAECPALAAWAARCVRENECVAASLPEAESVFQFVCGMRKHFGLD